MRLATVIAFIALTTTLTAGEGPPAVSVDASIRKSMTEGNTGKAVGEYNSWALREKFAQTKKLSNSPSISSLGNWLRQAGFSEQEIASPVLEPRDEEHLQRMIFLKSVADLASEEGQNRQEKADRIFDFVTTEILPIIPDGYIFELPEDVLIRGYGSCDQMSWAMCALAEQIGIEGMVIFLKDPKTGKSPHTVASLKIGDKWHIYDPFSALIYSNSKGERSNLLMALLSPAEVSLPPKRSGKCLLVPKDLPYSSILVYSDLRGALPRWNLFQFMVKPESPRLWWNPSERISSVKKDLSEIMAQYASTTENGGRQFSPAEVEKSLASLSLLPYGDPVTVYKNYQKTGWQNLQTISRSRGKFYRARRLHLTGKIEGALAEFDRLKPLSTVKVDSEGNTEKLSDEYADWLAYRSHSLCSSGRLEEAAKGYSILQKFPNFWQDQIRWNLAIALQKAENDQDSEKVFRDLYEPRKAAGRRRAEKLK